MPKRAASLRRMTAVAERTHLLCLALLMAGATATAAANDSERTAANVPIEITFTAQRPHADPFNSVELDAIFTDPAGVTRKVPAFWAGGDTWKVRYASPQSGTHHWTSACNDPTDPGLDHHHGTIEVARYSGANPLYGHGPIRVAPDKRHLEHMDGTSFFWLGDTWWMGLCHRLHWPDEFAGLAADRKAKGFNVIQIVAGLYPDMFPFDPRGANEAGHPWTTNYSSVRPEYFDAADRRLQHLVNEGLTPCIVGAWGYFMPWMGVDKMKQHWRYLIARYGSWPVIWCAAGEANLPWYLAKGFPYDDRRQVHDWTEVMRFIRATDPFHRPLTIHPTGIGRLSARNATDDTSLLDIDLLQTPHGQREAVAPTIRTMRESYPDRPTMPVINGEASYEMLFDRIPSDWPRAMFWVCMLNGAAGHTYGANGIWQLNRRDKPHGASPNGSGNGYGVIPWDEAMHLPGSQQVALGKRFLEKLPWTKLLPRPGGATWAEATAMPERGSWIWFPEGDPKQDAPVGARWFRRTFIVPDNTVRRGRLSIAADDRFTAWLNGREIGAGADWQTPANLDVAAGLHPGTNILAIRAENVKAPVAANPAGLNAALAIEFEQGDPLVIRSDAQWKTAKSEAQGWNEQIFDDATWSNALVAARYGEGPWGQISKAPAPIEPQAAGIEDRVRVIYALDPRAVKVRNLARGAHYRVTRFDPVTGRTSDAETLAADAAGNVTVAPPAWSHDWVLMLAR